MNKIHDKSTLVDCAQALDSADIQAKWVIQILELEKDIKCKKMKELGEDDVLDMLGLGIGILRRQRGLLSTIRERVNIYCGEAIDNNSKNIA